MAAIIDDKSPICIPFILSHLEEHLKTKPGRPFFVGLNGVQGVGKTTLVKALATTLTSQGHNTLVFSIDDLYLPHAEQQALAAAHPDNALVQQRGEPGTHDLDLARRFFGDILAGNPTRVPSYDKSQFSGQGDRAPESTWEPINQPGQPPVRVVIFEGWSVGFRALSDADVESRWRAPGTRTLAKHPLDHLLFVNDKLRGYDDLTNLLDVFVHIDAEDTQYVYDWRLQQEAALRAERGTGMTDEQVVKFVDGYYPAYELFSPSLRTGVFPDRPKHQLRMIVAKDRKVKESHVV
ncbi:D-glycerate 3-kinase [Plectosphaerella plurivora]|uniref:D-glycerate 3-kinase n=1 Tax=Plectosphaerella plurivora TaxID=936078 RepID=A0A9P9AEM4_9PEZI|nr:D-glycerate 3-kinase [Plectosphaerella plurivora]